MYDIVTGNFSVGLASAGESIPVKVDDSVITIPLPDGYKRLDILHPKLKDILTNSDNTICILGTNQTAKHYQGIFDDYWGERQKNNENRQQAGEENDIVPQPIVINTVLSEGETASFHDFVEIKDSW